MSIDAKINKILVNQIHNVYKELFTTIKNDLVQVCKTVSAFKSQLM